MKSLIIWFLVLLLKIFKWLSYLIFLKILELGNFGFKKEQIFGHQVLMYFRATRLEKKKLKYLVEEVLCWFRQNAIKCTFKVWKSLSLSHPLTHSHTHTHTHAHTHTHPCTHPHTYTHTLAYSLLPSPFVHHFFSILSFSFLSTSYL